MLRRIVMTQRRPNFAGIVAGAIVLFVAYCFDNMLWHYERADAVKGAQVGILTGVCIFGAMLVNLYSFEVRPAALILIDGGYGIVGFVLSGAVVGALRGRMSRSRS